MKILGGPGPIFKPVVRFITLSVMAIGINLQGCPSVAFFCELISRKCELRFSN